MDMRRIARLSLILLGVPAAAGAEAPFAFDRMPGKLPKTVVPDEYHVDLTPDLVRLTLAGHETVRLRLREATDTITLNQIDITIGKAVSETGAQATVTADAAQQTATLRFPAKLAAGTHTLTIDYTAPIPNTPAGLYYNDYRTAAGPAKRMLVTQFESTDARRMMPLWDEPAFKARFQLSVVLPQDYAAISNMPAEAETPAGPGRKRIRFGMSPRMSSYLVALIAGDLGAVRGTAANTRLGVWSPRGEEAQGQYALDVMARVLPYYNQYFGVPYPLPKLDLIAIPGNYQAGAMENWGAITFVDDGLLFDPATSTAATRERIHIYVAHEIAHQWSGDLVTMGWWDNLWLNEGFATWMEYKATDHFNPAWEIWPRQHEARELAMAQDALPTTHPVQQPIRDETEAATAFDGISYQKGSQIIRMVEDWVGPGKFRDGMRAYMHAHQYGSATSADLWAALGKASGQEVARVAAGFTEQPGVPLVRVARHCEGGAASLTLTADRFTIHDPAAKKLAWIIPVTLGGPGVPEHRVLLRDTPAVVKLPACDTPLKANFGENGYYRTEYDAASLNTLAANLRHFGAADRANLLGDQFALARAGRAPLASYLDLLAALHGETNSAVWDDTIAHLRSLDRLARGEAALPGFQARARALLRPAFDRLGWDPRGGEPFLDAQLRPSLIGLLGRLGDAAIIAEAQHRFARFTTNPASLPPDLRTPVLDIVGRHADAATWETLRALGEKATGTEEKLRFFDALAAAADPALIAKTVAFAASGEVPNGRVAQLISVASRETDNPEEVWRQTLLHQAELRRHLTPDAQTYLLPAAAIGGTTPKLAQQLLADPGTQTSLGAKIIAGRAADAILTAAEARQRLVPALAAWLATK